MITLHGRTVVPGEGQPPAAPDPLGFVHGKSAGLAAGHAAGGADGGLDG